MGASVENLILTLHNYTSNSQKVRLKMVLNNGTIEDQFSSESQEPPFSFHNYSKNCISKPMLPNSKPMLPNSQPIFPNLQPILPSSKPIIPNSLPIYPNSKDSQPIFANSQPIPHNSQPIIPNSQLVFLDSQQWSTNSSNLQLLPSNNTASQQWSLDSQHLSPNKTSSIIQNSPYSSISRQFLTNSQQRHPTSQGWSPKASQDGQTPSTTSHQSSGACVGNSRAFGRQISIFSLLILREARKMTDADIEQMTQIVLQAEKENQQIS